VVTGIVVVMTELQPPPPGGPAQIVAGVCGVVSELGQTLWAARPPEELVETVVVLERLRSVVDAVQLQVVAELDATDGARCDQWASVKDFVTAVGGGRKGDGPRAVWLARAVTGDRVATGRALAEGRVSRVQAEVVVRAVDRLPVNPALRDAAEQLLLTEAVTRDATELRKVAATVLERLDPDGAERRDERALDRLERAAHLGRFFSISEDGIGGVRVRGRGTVEDAAQLKAVLMPLAAPQPASQPGACGGDPGRSAGDCGVASCAHDGRDPREHGTRMWDALIEASRLLAGTTVLPTSHGARPRVAVTIDHQTLVTGAGTGLLETGETLSASAVRRLACDADVLPLVLGSRSQVLDVGRTRRLVTLGLWLALLARDRTCAFPGCGRPPIACDAHHIVHWADGGPTSLDNLVLLCRTHHTVIHTTGWQVRLDNTDRHPEFLPPARLDPHRRPIRHRELRTTTPLRT